MRLGEACACAAMAASLVASASVARADTTPPAPAAPASDEGKPPRPPLPPLPAPQPVPWEQHVEIGGGIAFVEDLGSTLPDGSATPVRLRPGVGFHVRLAWQLLRYLSFVGYMNEVDHPLSLPAGSLGLSATLTGPDAHSYFFGGCLAPTLPIGERVRLWATVGGGWGLVSYPDLTGTAKGVPPFTVRGRTTDVVEIPVGLGVSFEIIPRWLRVHAELTYSFYPSQLGDATGVGQTVEAGNIQNVGPFPHLDGAFTQVVGATLIL